MQLAPPAWSDQIERVVVVTLFAGFPEECRSRLVRSLHEVELELAC
ncbi:hypothetical protein DB30_04423 [Enhygromyxa salina]|uniref:Uncharacterized protein n=1 Tax=Enhygromyxa salina TaxID=215803 RepID=A0A0C2D497_9BACT|nr:hypothetical protein DB30_04423 [Enhygromyxa salina]